MKALSTVLKYLNTLSWPLLPVTAPYCFTYSKQLLRARVSQRIYMEINSNHLICVKTAFCAITEKESLKD